MCLNLQSDLQVRALLNIIIVDAVRFFNVGKTMTANQTIQTVDLILQDYKHFKPEDFKLCFSNAKKGHYGQLFDRIDGQVIMQWLITYDNERDAAVEAIRVKEHKDRQKQLQQITPGPDNQQLKAHISKLLQPYEEKKKAADAVQAHKQEAARQQNPVYAMHQRWIRQFYDIKLRKEARANKPLGYGFITRYGLMPNRFRKPGSSEPVFVPRRLDISAFLEHKQWQYNEYLKRRK